MEWIRFFFGTPARLFVWLVLAGLVTVMVAPGLLAVAFGRLMSEVLGPLLVLGIMYLGFRVMFQGLIGGGNHRRRK